MQNNVPASVFIAIGTAGLATLLGYFLGSQWADTHGLRRIWKSAIPRDTSAWKKLFDAAPDNTVVQVAVILKSGAWISGELYEFDADPDPHPHRAIVLTQPQYKPSDSDDAAPLEGVDWIVIEASDIEQLQAAFVEVEELEDTSEDGDD